MGSAARVGAHTTLALSEVCSQEPAACVDPELGLEVARWRLLFADGARTERDVAASI
jgi:hypothetical protein